MLEEHTCLIFTFKHFPMLRYRGHAKKCKPLLHCAEYFCKICKIMNQSMHKKDCKANVYTKM